MDPREYYKDTPNLTAEFCRIDLKKLNLDGTIAAAKPENARKVVEALDTVQNVINHYEDYRRAFLETLPAELLKLKQSLLNHAQKIADRQGEVHALVLKEIEVKKRKQKEYNEKRRQDWLRETTRAAELAAVNFLYRFNSYSEDFQDYLAKVWEGLSMKDFVEKNIFIGSEIHLKLHRPPAHIRQNELITHLMYNAGYMLYVIVALNEMKFMADRDLKGSTQFQEFLVTSNLPPDVYVDGLFEPQSLVLGWNSPGYWDRIYLIFKAVREHWCFRQHMQYRRRNADDIEEPSPVMSIDTFAPALAVVAVLTNHEFDWVKVFDSEYPRWDPPKEENDEEEDEDHMERRLREMLR